MPLVTRAHDDPDAERFDVRAVLALSAAIGWREDCDGGERVSETGADHAGGIVGAHDYIVVISDPATGEIDAEDPLRADDATLVADRARAELFASGLHDFTVSITRLRRPRPIPVH